MATISKSTLADPKWVLLAESKTFAPTDIKLTVAPPSTPTATTEGKVESDERKPMTLRGIPMASLQRTRHGAEFRCNLARIVSVVTSGAGAINVTVQNTGVTASTEWTSISTVFDEFFIHSMSLKYIPINQFLSPTGVTFTAPMTGSLFCVNNYHAAPVYTTASSLVNNITHKMVGSGTPWTYTWTNNEKASGGVVTNPSTSVPLATQSWCLTPTSNASLYLGHVQIMTANPLSGALTVPIGEITIVWDITFRARA